LPGVLCLALAAGCTTVVDGTGRLAEGVPTPSTPSPGTGEPSEPTGPPYTGPAYPPEQPTRQSLACGEVTIIRPAGAPYCFALPAGFTDVSKSVTVDAGIGSERFRSGVAVSEHDRDVIIVTTYELRVNADPIPDDVLESELRSVLRQLSKQGFSFDSTTARRTTVDGARAFAYHARERRGSLQADVYFAFRGRTELEINCQWRDKPGEIRRGCRSVLSSMQLKTVE
jgi:hypothetical protein